MNCVFSGYRVSKEEDVTEGHTIVPDGYDIGRYVLSLLLSAVSAFERDTDVDVVILLYVGITSSPAPSAPHLTAASPIRPLHRTSPDYSLRGVLGSIMVCFHFLFPRPHYV